METALDQVVRGMDVQRWLAGPVEPSHRQNAWLTAPKSAFAPLRKVIGDRSSKVMDRAYAGSCTWLNGVFWVEVVKEEKKHVVVQNMGDVGRTKVDTHVGKVDGSFLYPLLRGRDLLAWNAEPSAWILVPHEASHFGEPVSVARMKREFSHTFDFLKRFETKLRARSGYKQLHRSRDEFYVIGNVGNYALAPFKVAFKDLSEVFQCAVVGPCSLDGHEPKPVIPDHTVLFLTADTEEEAHFLAGLLNSAPGRAALYSASVGVQTQRYFPTDVSRVLLPEFDRADRAHQRIVSLSRKLHNSQRAHAERGSDESGGELADAVATIWDLTEPELNAITSYYRELQQYRRRLRPDCDSDEEKAEE